MRTTIDASGRIVIPKRLRDAAGLCGPAEVDIEVHDGRIEIDPIVPRVRFVREGFVLVPVIEGQSEETWDFDLDAFREEMERERFGI